MGDQHPLFPSLDHSHYTLASCWHLYQTKLRNLRTSRWIIREISLKTNQNCSVLLPEKHLTYRITQTSKICLYWSGIVTFYRLKNCFSMCRAKMNNSDRHDGSPIHNSKREYDLQILQYFWCHVMGAFWITKY